MSKLNSNNPQISRSPKTLAFRDSILGDVESAVMLGMYQHVANVRTSDLDEAFALGNIGPAERIEKLNRLMHSISVGDLLVDSETGCVNICKPMGWEKLPDFFSMYLNSVAADQMGVSQSSGSRVNANSSLG